MCRSPVIDESPSTPQYWDSDNPAYRPRSHPRRHARHPRSRHYRHNSQHRHHRRSYTTGDLDTGDLDTGDIATGDLVFEFTDAPKRGDLKSGDLDYVAEALVASIEDVLDQGYFGHLQKKAGSGFLEIDDEYLSKFSGD